MSSRSESPPPSSRGLTFAWGLLAFVDGLFFLENTPLSAAPAWALWLTLAALVVGFVSGLRWLGLLRIADHDGGTPLGPSTRWRSGEFWLRFAVAASSGALLALISPPANWHLVHWFAFLPMFWALRADRFWENFAIGWAYGAFALTFIFYWVIDTIALYSNIPTPAAFGLLLLGAGALFGWLYLPAWIAVHPLRRRFGAWWVVLFPTVLVATEFFVSFIIIFPYQMGVAHYQSLAVWQLSSLTGVWGVSWLVAFFNAGLAEPLYRHREGRPALGLTPGLVLAVLATVLIWGQLRFNRIEAQLRAAESIRVAQLQSPHDMVFRMFHQGRRESFEEWLDRSARFRPGTVDLMIWPEGASSYDLNRGTAHDAVGEYARRGHWEMIVGGGTRERTNHPEFGTQDRAFNTVFYFDEQGVLVRRYDKMVPLLFGEYLPWWLLWLSDYVQGVGDFDAGTEPVVFQTDHAAMATPICYEAIFGGVCRRYVGAEVLVNLTNDAWFGDTGEPHQHGMLAALRATELGVPVVRSAYSGISFIVEPHGAMHYETEPFTEVARVTELRLAAVPTLYARIGDWFAWLCVIVGLGTWGVLVLPGQTMSSKDQSRT